MKFSLYNSIIPLTEKSSVIYNALSNQYIIFNSSVDLMNIEREPEAGILLNELKKGRHLIKDTVDEIMLVKDRIKNAVLNDEYYDLIINPTLNCNFRCWYCYEKHILNSQMNLETLNNVRKHMTNIITKQENLKYFHLSFFGGEPLMYFKQTVKPLIKYFNQICVVNDLNYDIGFTSNGYFITTDMLSFFKKNRVSCFQITLDGYKNEHDKVRFVSEKKGSYDVILKNVKLLLEEKIKVTLRINYTAANIDGVKNILGDLIDIESDMKLNLRIDFQQVWQDRNPENGVEDVVANTIRLFRENGFRVSRREPATIENPCYADKKYQALINYNGDVFKCTARDFLSERRDGFLDQDGNIVWENDALERRLNVKLNNTYCLSCRIAPLCCGGCAQQGMENEGEPCVLRYSEKKKDQVVLSRLRLHFIDSNRIKMSGME